MIIEIQDYWAEREIYKQAELCSKIIHGMQTDGEVILMTKEARCARTNGGYALLDALCEYWKWDKSKITLITTNVQENHNEYIIKCSGCQIQKMTEKTDIDMIPWNKEKVYGLFIGRATSLRIHAAHKHQTFKFKEYGLSSFHTDLFNFMDKNELVDYFMESGQTYQEMISLKPYSDIDVVKKVPIVNTVNDKIDWDSVYSKIGIEIVCETSASSTNATVTEKLERCIKYRRPFLTLCPPGYNKFLNNITWPGGNYRIRTFDNYFVRGYDDLYGKARVDAVFQILEDLIESGKIYNILEDCKEDIEHNYNMNQAALEFHKQADPSQDLLWSFWKNKLSHVKQK